jgi:hypothetical protein
MNPKYNPWWFQNFGCVYPLILAFVFKKKNGLLTLKRGKEECFMISKFFFLEWLSHDFPFKDGIEFFFSFPLKGFKKKKRDESKKREY